MGLDESDCVSGPVTTPAEKDRVLGISNSRMDMPGWGSIFFVVGMDTVTIEFSTHSREFYSQTSEKRFNIQAF
jgi:hypothetical protein